LASVYQGLANNIAEELARRTQCVVTEPGDSGRMVDDLDLS